MKRLLAIAALLLWCTAAQAANHYIRDGATGSTCADWGSNACDQLPASLVRGDTYFIADGSYSSRTYEDAASGTSVITIKKCTASDHGTETGYVSTYCDGQADIGEINVKRPYYVWDGQARNEGDWKASASYGFRTNGVRSSRLDGGHTGSDCSGDHLTFRYMHVGTSTTSFATYSGGQSFYIGGFGGPGAIACEDWTISRVLVQNTDEVQCAGGDGITIEYAYFYIGWAKEAIRGQVACSNVTVRHSVFENSCLTKPATTDRCTAEIAAWDGSAGTMNGWKVYGNVFWRHGTDVENSNGIVLIGDSGWGGAIGPTTNNSAAYNNSFHGINVAAGTAAVRLDGGTGNEARNNLTYGMNGQTSTFSANTVSNNVHATSNPYVNASGGDFHLSAATSAGTTLSSPYDVDMDGVTRGADGTWDVGAFEFDEGGGVPDAPTNFRLVSHWFIGLALLLGALLLRSKHASGNRRNGPGFARVVRKVLRAANHAMARRETGRQAAA